jgi:hypothetical protein
MQPSPLTPFVAIIGDIVGSRSFEGRKRRDLQHLLNTLLGTLNKGFAEAIAVPFTITRGDEWEGLVLPAAAPQFLPELIWKIELMRRTLPLRLGIGFGAIDTELLPEAGQNDGPAFHAARRAIENAAEKKIPGGVFQGFGAKQDQVLNGLSMLLHTLRQRWSPQQREVIHLLRRGMRQVEVASALERSRQAVSTQTRAAAWPAYSAGENALRIALRACLERKIPQPGNPAGENAGF